MRYTSCIFIIFILFAPQVSAQETHHSEPFRTILTGEEIKDAGTTRLSELFHLVEEWNGYSLDGIDWFASANGLSPYQNQNWLVMLDGQRVDLQYFDTQNINMLPISISLIDEVVILHTPQLYLGEYSERGLIHIKTKEADKGTSVNVRMASGNEVNDPGPYGVTGLETPNVERIGPDFDLNITQTLSNWHVRVGLSTHEHKNTDLPINKRIRRMRVVDNVWHDGNLYMHSPSFNIGWRGDDNHHTAYGGHTRFQDFLFFKPFGREVPVVSKYTHGGINGEMQLSNQSRLRYRTSWSNRDLKHRKNAFDLDFDFQLVTLHGNVEYQFSGNEVFSSVGVSLDQTNASTGYNLDNNKYQLGSIYSNVQTWLTTNTRQSLDVMIRSDFRETAMKTALHQQWLIKNNQKASLSISYNQRLFSEDQSLWYWAERGYGFMDELNVDLHIDGELNSGHQFTTDLKWQKKWGNEHMLSFSTYYRAHRNTYLNNQDFEYDSSQGWLEAPVFIRTGLNSNIAGFRSHLALQLLPQLKQELQYGYRRILNADQEFQDSWNMMPRHQIQSRTTFKPVENLSLFALIRYRSSTTWDEYTAIDGEEYKHLLGLGGGIYSSSLPSLTTLDLAARKSFWKRKLFASLLVRNVFDRDHYYHPFGIDYNLTMFVQIELSI